MYRARPMGSLDKVIRDAAVNVKAGKLDRALDALLAAWPQNPSRELSEAIIALDAKWGLPAFEGDSAAWRVAAKTANPRSGARCWRRSTERSSPTPCSAWAARSTDPRTANTIAALVASTPWSSDSSKGACARCTRSWKPCHSRTSPSPSLSWSGGIWPLDNYR